MSNHQSQRLAEMTAILLDTRQFLLAIKPTSRQLMNQQSALLARIDAQLSKHRASD